MYMAKATARRLVDYAVSSVRVRAIRESVDDTLGYCFYVFRAEEFHSFSVCIKYQKFSRTLMVRSRDSHNNRIIMQECKNFKELKEAIEIIKNAIESA